jgi:hypothetical protein
MKKFEKFELASKQAQQIVGGGWVTITTGEGTWRFNDKNGNLDIDPGESWYFIPHKTNAQ